MADAKHKVERAAFGAAIDGILKYVNKDETDREKAFLKLVDLSEKFMGDTFRKESYDAARRMIQDPDSKWMQYEPDLKRSGSPCHQNVRTGLWF